MSFTAVLVSTPTLLYFCL